MPTQAPTTTPTIAPTITPWPERQTDPATICPQQRRETASPDVAP